MPATADNHKTGRSVTELVCDLTLVERQLRAVRRWTPQCAVADIDAALSDIGDALANLYAELPARAAEQTATGADLTP